MLVACFGSDNVPLYEFYFFSAFMRSADDAGVNDDAEDGRFRDKNNVQS